MNEQYLSLEEIANRTKLPKKSLAGLYKNKTVRNVRGPGRAVRFHVEDVRKTLNGHGHLLDPPKPSPETMTLVAYEILGARLGLKSKEEAFDRIAVLTPNLLS